MQRYSTLGGFASVMPAAIDVAEVMANACGRDGQDLTLPRRLVDGRSPKRHCRSAEAWSKVIPACEKLPSAAQASGPICPRDPTFCHRARLSLLTPVSVA